MLKNPPAKKERWVWPLDWKGPLKKEMATHSGILAWEIPWTEEPGGLWSMGLQRIWHSWVIKKQNRKGHPVSLASLSTWKFLSPGDDRVEESGLCFSFLPFPWWCCPLPPDLFCNFLPTYPPTIFLMSLWEVCGEESAGAFEFFLYLCFQQVQYLYTNHIWPLAIHWKIWLNS